MLSLSQETPLGSTGIYASESTVSPLCTAGHAIQFGSMVTHPAGASTLSPAAQQAIGLRVDTTSTINISDGVASEAERQAAQQMFKRRTQKQGSQKRHDPGLMKRLKMSVGIFLGLLLFGGLILVVAAPNDQPNTYTTDGIAHDESEARNSTKLAPPQPAHIQPRIWNWVAGGSQGNQNGVYYGSGAWPGSRSYATQWTVSHANGQVDLYMFGGVGCDSVTSGSDNCGDLGFAHNPDNLDAAADSGCEF
jgi:hypothetical protein